MIDLLQQLYDSEINFKIETFWDGGFYWYLGDDSNGWKASGVSDTAQLAVEHLCKAAGEAYPQSSFAKPPLVRKCWTCSKEHELIFDGNHMYRY